MPPTPTFRKTFHQQRNTVQIATNDADMTVCFESSRYKEHFVSGAAVVEKRSSTADIESVLNTLKSSTDTILPQITALTSGGTASDATVTPLISDLTAALDTASASLATLSPVESRKRQSDDDIANLVAGIVTDVANALDGLLSEASTIPDLGTLLAGVDTSLNQVLVGLETLLAGVLNLVATLLVDVAGLLRSLALGLTLASLGL
ncbi:Sc15 protein [Mycena venus]|uniref:Sc15 protein n=1 Tax=Mycena venus TaxID=2733690 RepID=A0A8H6YNW9_9AGAR|nr:Sc15 protein [Mycena venus]